MKRVATLMWIMCLTAGVYGVYHLKYQVVQRERELSQIRKEILEERQYVHVLEAELAHLARPQRLAKLAKDNTTLEPLKPEMIVSINDIPMRPLPPTESHQVDPEANDPIGGLIEKFNLVSAKP